MKKGVRKKERKKNHYTNWTIDGTKDQQQTLFGLYSIMHNVMIVSYGYKCPLSFYVSGIFGSEYLMIVQQSIFQWELNVAPV